MADNPQWSVEFTVRDSKTGSSREVRIESDDLAEATMGAVAAMGGVFGVELSSEARRIGDLFGGRGGGFRA